MSARLIEPSACWSAPFRHMPARQIKIQSKRCLSGILHERPVYFSVLQCGLGGGGQHSHGASRSSARHKFLIWLFTHTDSGHSQSLSYSNLPHHFKIPSLVSRRVQHDLLLLRNIIRGKVDCPVLLESFSLHVPSRPTRTVSVLTVPRARVQTVDSGMFCRVPRAMDAYLGSTSNPGVFYESLAVFRAYVIRYV